MPEILVVGGCEDVDRGEVVGDGECADELRPVDEHERADRARDALIAAISERWPVAVWTPLNATRAVPPSTRGATRSGSTPPLRKGTWRTS